MSKTYLFEHSGAFTSVLFCTTNFEDLKEILAFAGSLGIELCKYSTTDSFFLIRTVAIGCSNCLKLAQLAEVAGWVHASSIKLEKYSKYMYSGFKVACSMSKLYVTTRDFEDFKSVLKIFSINEINVENLDMAKDDVTGEYIYTLISAVVPDCKTLNHVWNKLRIL